jgi:hypothetical protein
MMSEEKDAAEYALGDWKRLAALKVASVCVGFHGLTSIRSQRAIGLSGSEARMCEHFMEKWSGRGNFVHHSAALVHSPYILVILVVGTPSGYLCQTPLK